MSQIDTQSKGVGITVVTATAEPCQAVYVGVAANYDFCFDGTNWIAFTGCIAGSLLPIQVKGARVSGGASPGAGAIVFLY